jgi:nucleoside-diphosphate-sugar epimerase
MQVARCGIRLAVKDIIAPSWPRDFIAGSGSILGRIMGVTPEIKFGPTRAGDIRHSLCDWTFMLHELGFKPSTDLQDGLRHMLAK